VLKVESLRKSWPGFELSADLALGDSEIGAILGPSGSGKSSLLRIIAGLERPDSGRIVMDGADLAPLPPERRGIGMVFQDYALFPAKTVAGNISYGPAVAGLPKAERNRITRVLAAEFGIDRLLDRYPSSLSGGERQRVALARTLAARPSLVLLDEPLSSLDEGLRKRLRVEIADRLRAAGTSALHVTHDVEEALAIADRVFIMREGRIESSGTPEEIYAEPRSAWAASFMGSGPVIPVDSIEGAPGSPRARCSIGAISCREVEPTYVSNGRYSVFFQSDAATIIHPDFANFVSTVKDETVNRFTCEVVSTFFAGRFRRVVLTCGSLEQRIRIELDQPPSVRPAVGELVGLEVPVSRCILLPGCPMPDMSEA